MTRSKRAARRDYEIGSGNVYADLGCAEPDAMLVKARLVTKIAEILREREHSRTRAAQLLCIAQPKLSNLLAGRFRGFSERKLMNFLSYLSTGTST